MPRSCAPEFRKKVLDLVEEGRPIAEVAEMLGISDQSIRNWRRQHLIDTGQILGITSGDTAELVAARRRIAELHAAGIAGFGQWRRKRQPHPRSW